MVRCKHIKERILPISFQEEENFQNINCDYFFLCLITDGYAVLMIDGERSILVKNMILCLKPERTVTLLASKNLRAYSISFAPAFINVNLKFDLIKSLEYSQLCRDFGYPDFSLFMNYNSIYKGIMPLDVYKRQAWVREDKWIVYQDQIGDRVVLNSNVGQTNAIMSPIKASDITKV